MDIHYVVPSKRWTSTTSPLPPPTGPEATSKEMDIHYVAPQSGPEASSKRTTSTTSPLTPRPPPPFDLLRLSILDSPIGSGRPTLKSHLNLPFKAPFYVANPLVALVARITQARNENTLATPALGNAKGAGYGSETSAVWLPPRAKWWNGL